MSKTLPGRRVWYELLTADVDSASAFYKQLFGWTGRPSANMPAYTLLEREGDGAQVAGMMPLDDQMQGAPPHWAVYITVHDIDAAVEAIKAEGGQVLMGPMAVPGVGRFACAVDPGGAVLYPFEDADEDATPEGKELEDHGFCWSQLMSHDVHGSLKFYEAVFGWTSEPMGEGVVFKRGGQMVASATPLPAEAPAPPHWLSYVAVPDVDASYAAAGELGAQQHHPPKDIPGMGRFAVLADPTGATFALWRDASLG